MLIVETETKTMIFDCPEEWKKAREVYECLGWEIKFYGSDDKAWYFQAERYL